MPSILLLLLILLGEFSPVDSHAQSYAEYPRDQRECMNDEKVELTEIERKVKSLEVKSF